MSHLFFKLSGGVALALGCLVLTPARAVDGPSSLVLDAPFSADQATPAWLGHPAKPDTIFARLDLPITPPDKTSSLLVTVYFHEKEGGFLRISWQDIQSSELLSDNFYEGIGMSNQRSLLISPEVLQEDGILGFQSGDTALGIDRIKLEWLENKPGLVSPLIQDMLVTPSSGSTQPVQNFDGQPKLADEAAWHDEFVVVPITEMPQRIEEGVEYSVQLDSAPKAGRLALKEAGLPWGQHLVVWINQQRAGTISPAVPDLADGGFLATAPDSYEGWRDGTFYVPVSLLKAGVNTLQFSGEQEGPATQPVPDPTDADAVKPLAVKDVVLTLCYPPAGTDGAASAPSPAPTASLPAPLSDSSSLSLRPPEPNTP